MTNMAKPRQKQNSSAAEKNKQNNRDSRDDEEEDWVVVKRQKVTIVIPPLPTKVLTTVPNLGQGHLQENPTKSESPLRMKTTSNVQCQSGNPISNEALERTKNSTSQAVCSPEAWDSSEPNLTSQKKKPSSVENNNNHSLLRDRRKRAAYLDKKLKRAGGLDNWLASLGLNCFVEIFRRRNIDKFQLANMNMEKLKDMGLDAVGPRRKLIHAIDCVCQPHCFVCR